MDITGNDLTPGRLLVADKLLGLTALKFARSVFLILPSKGTEGVVAVNIAGLCKLGMHLSGPQDCPVLVLFKADSAFSFCSPVGETGYYISQTKGFWGLLSGLAIRKVEQALGQPDSHTFLIGCMIWTMAQLLNEIGEGRWHSTKASLDELMQVPASMRYQLAVSGTTNPGD